jgi:hypothetical protein
MIDEYLYVDEKRLDYYIGQIGAPVAFDKVPRWTVSFSIAGPKVEGTQERPPRPLTIGEKINRLMDHLHTNKDSLGEGRAGREALGLRSVTRVFRLETCEAVKVFIPLMSAKKRRQADQMAETQFFDSFQTAVRKTAKRLDSVYPEGRAAGFTGLNLWFSDKQLGPDQLGLATLGQLLLVVDFPHDDLAHYGQFSAYSVLHGLLNELRSDLERTVLHPASTQRPELPGSFQQLFARAPVRTLLEIGANVAPPRVIKTLYRVREVVPYLDPSEDKEKVATFGYPIFITPGNL